MAVMALVTAAAMPFAVVSDAVVAGIFSVCNTILNAATLYFLNKAISHSKDAAAEATIARKIVDNRKEKVVPPPDRKFKRGTDK
jgi:uncharacterized membrane protein